MESNFKGLVDLVEMKATIYKDDLGKEMEVVDVPEDMKADAEKYADSVVEKLLRA